MSSFDVTLLDWITAGDDPNVWVLLVGCFVAQWGSALCAVLIGWAAWHHKAERRFIIILLLAAGLAAIGSHALAAKLGFQRPFAEGLAPAYIWHSASASLPSTHATVMFFVAMAFATHALLRRTAVPLLGVALATGWARVYVGVHFPADIAAGFALALVLAVMFCVVARVMRPRPAIQDSCAQVGTLREEERRKWRSS